MGSLLCKKLAEQIASVFLPAEPAYTPPLLILGEKLTLITDNGFNYGAVVLNRKYFSNFVRGAQSE